MTLEETLERIKPLNQKAMDVACKRWDSIAKPLHSLGKLEDMVIRIAGITGDPDVDISKRALVAMCADNGVVEEGVTQTGQEITALVAENFLKGETSSSVMCRECRTDVFPVDVGMVTDTKVPKTYKVMYGTHNMAKEPAMTREQAMKGIQAGISMAEDLKEQGYQLLITGEMGIGNTTTSSAVASVLMNQPVEKMTGRGAGLTSAGLERKIKAIQTAVELHRPNPKDPVDVLAKVGGLDIAAMTGLYLGGAALEMPVVMDGFISCVAALAAKELCPLCAEYMLPSHVSKEPAAHLILEYLGMEAVIHGDMCLGEGTGGIALIPLLDMGNAVYKSMSTFDDIHMDHYEELV